MGEYLNKRMKGKQNTNGLKQNPQNCNRDGQPRKGISQVNKRLKDNGYAVAKKADIVETYLQMLQLDQDGIDKLVASEDQLPILTKILLNNLKDGKTFDIVEKMLDRTLGKAVQEFKGGLTVNNNPFEDLKSKVKKSKKINKKK